MPLHMKKYIFPLLSTFLLLICLGTGSTLLAQEKEAKKLQLGVNLSSSIVKLSEPAYLVSRIQAYSPGIFVRYGKHFISGNWDFYSQYLFDLQNRAPEGFQLGYRYMIPDLISYIELYGEFNYAYYSYVSTFQHLRYVDRVNSGGIHYVYMGNLAAGATFPFWDRFSVGGSVGYGASFVDLYILTLNRSVTEWRKHAYFRMEVNVRVF
jgi:hypothetical protein